VNDHIQAIPTEFNGIEYRSRLEADMARVLTMLDVPFEYEARSYLLPNGQHYRPDFLLACDAAIETRGYRSAESDAQLAAFMRCVAERQPGFPRLFCGLIAGYPDASVAGATFAVTGLSSDLKYITERRPTYDRHWHFARFRESWLPVGAGVFPRLDVDLTKGEMAAALSGPSVWLDIDGESGRLVACSEPAKVHEFPMRLPQWRDVRACSTLVDLVGEAL